MPALSLGEPGPRGTKGTKGERKVILAQGEGAPGETGPPGPRGACPVYFLTREVLILPILL